MPPKAIVCELDEKFLMCRPEFSDRFVYSNYFTPLSVTYEDGDRETPLLTEYQKNIFLDYIAFDPDAFEKLIPKLDLPALLEVNGLDIDAELPRGRGGRGGNGRTDPVDEIGIVRDLADDTRTVRLEADRVHTEVEDARSLIGMLPRDELDNPELVDLLARHVERIGRSTSRLSGVSESLVRAATTLVDEDVDQPEFDVGRETGTRRSAMVVAERAYTGERRGRASVVATSPPTEQQLDLLLNLLKSEVGYLFLDRTRIRPVGFAIGEHVYTLSLAPAEEVILEQKTFSKRAVTFEEQTEQERQLDLELSSSLSTEIQEGFERQKSRSATAGVTAGGSVGGNIYGVQVSANVSYSKNLTEANTATQRRSVKESSTSSEKIASKYRTAHKINFKVSTEQGFEQSSKRTIRNPNRFTPLTLEYFKQLQVLELTQERYGVRLCWAPCVRDPAFEFVQRVRKGKEEILKKAETGIELPPRPTPPTKTAKPAIWQPSGQIEADRWGFWNDMSADYDITIPAPANYVWDGNAASVKSSLSVNVQNVNRSHDEYVVGEPWLEGSDVKLKVHVGVDWVIGKRGSIYLTAGANFVPDPHAEDPEYKKSWETYQQALTAWQTKVDELLGTARAEAAEEAEAWEAEMLKQFNPIAELMNRIISHNFPPAVRDDCWEIDLWQNVFDWDDASYVVFPGWWNGGPMRDWTKDPADFMNASWAKLYVPIKIGFEDLALRWVYGKVIDQKLDANRENAFKKMIKDLKEFRKKNFGDEAEARILDEPDEHDHPHSTGETCPVYDRKVLCLAHWREFMPTDGTHAEVVQGMTSAEDPITKIEVDAVTKAKAALIDSHEQDVALKKKAVGAMAAPIDVEVKIDTDGGGAES